MRGACGRAIFYAICGRVPLSAPLLILAFAPAPFIFQRYITRLVNIFGIHSLGPIQLASPPVHLMGPLFSSLDTFLALMTKAPLIWLAEQPNGTSETNLKQQAINMGIPNSASAIQALINTGCLRREWGGPPSTGLRSGLTLEGPLENCRAVFLIADGHFPDRSDEQCRVVQRESTLTECNVRDARADIAVEKEDFVIL
jgi:hypothetical protein